MDSDALKKAVERIRMKKLAAAQGETELEAAIAQPPPVEEPPAEPVGDVAVPGTDAGEMEIGPEGQILNALIAAYCTELASAYQYEFARVAALGKTRNWFVSECEQHRDEEWEHAQLLAARIVTLGGIIPFDLSQAVQMNPAPVAQETEDNRDTDVLRHQILLAEQEAVKIYTKLEKMTREIDPVTNDMVIGILGTEQDHVVDMIKIGYTIQAE